MTDEERVHLMGAVSPRQQQVWRLVAYGCTNQEVAGALGIDERTARTHVAALLEIFDVRNRTELALIYHNVQPLYHQHLDGKLGKMLQEPTC